MRKDLIDSISTTEKQATKNRDSLLKMVEHDVKSSLNALLFRPFSAERKPPPCSPLSASIFLVSRRLTVIEMDLLPPRFSSLLFFLSPSTRF